MTAAPVTLVEIRAIPNIEARIRAATLYIDHAEQQAADARKVRDDDVRTLIATYGPSEAARRSGLSLSTIKLIKGRP
ncbi:MAG: hypothetical protein AB7G23_21140 [Vicinamibacterales bacterium]